MVFVVYKITNLVNGKIYIGKTNDLGRRWKEHLKHAKANKPYPIHRAISKYGSNNFSKEILEAYSDEQNALQGEINFISKYRSNNKEIGYNLTIGGESIVGYVFSEEAKRKISQAHLGKILSEDHKENIAKGFSEMDRAKQADRFRGEKSNNAKLNEQQVREIKQLIKDGLSNRKIAKMFGVGKSIISDIGRGRCWSHVTIRYN